MDSPRPLVAAARPGRRALSAECQTILSFMVFDFASCRTARFFLAPASHESSYHRLLFDSSLLVSVPPSFPRFMCGMSRVCAMRSHPLSLFCVPILAQAIRVPRAQLRGPSLSWHAARQTAIRWRRGSASSSGSCRKVRRNVTTSASCYWPPLASCTTILTTHAGHVSDSLSVAMRRARVHGYLDEHT